MKQFKWTEQQNKALRGSIRKWTKIVNGTGTDEGSDNCPCCHIWVFQPDICVGCPIHAFTGRKACNGTPYRMFEEVFSPEDPEYAVIELNFLKALYLAGGGKL